ncbi:MAG: nitroreductase [Spirochaetota bacterium]|nr:nitroreductase [Spirochaetota bacterium]
MEFIDVMKNRRSIRRFKSDTISRDIFDGILKDALWAPSWGNTQPWEIAVLGPDIIKKISNEFVENVTNGKPIDPDLEMPDSWPPKHKRRYVDVGRALFTTIGIERTDKEARFNHYLNMYKFFEAPHMIYVYQDKGISSHYGPFDLGALTNNICLLAYERGLGTCILASSAHYPDVIRKHTNISKDKLIIIGIAIGYPDENDPSYTFRSDRDESVISWHGVS